MTTNESLQSLGWRPHFETQLESGDSSVAARICSVHRGRVELIHADGLSSIELGATSAAMSLAVGDWVTTDASCTSVLRRLEPFSLFKRRAPGSGAEVQRIAANVDTLFIVTSANRDFNVARLERYLAIAQDAGVFPVVVITKIDLNEEFAACVSDASRLSPGILVEPVNATDPAAVEVLRGWCTPGQTVALLGSSGVGKSTIVNSLAGTSLDTQAAREDDQRGRHTTTYRSMHRLEGGGWLIDTPGMRELQLVDVGEALDDVFAEIAVLAADCRFADCSHESEPGCAVQAAINSGTLDAKRLQRYRKLLNEDRRNSETLAERRSRDKSLGRLYRSVQLENRRKKGG